MKLPIITLRFTDQLGFLSSVLVDELQQLVASLRVAFAGLASPEVTVSALPGSPVAGDVANVSNSTTNTWGATVAGGGSFHVAVRWNGTVWTVTGK